MKKIVSFFVVIAFFVTQIPVFSTAAPVKIKTLSQTLLTVDEFKKLDSEGQALYVVYALSMLSILDDLQGPKEYYLEQKKGTRKNSVEIKLFSEAHAAVPIVVGIAMVAWRGIQFIPRIAPAAKNIYQTAVRAHTALKAARSGAQTAKAAGQADLFATAANGATKTGLGAKALNLLKHPVNVGLSGASVGWYLGSAEGKDVGAGIQAAGNKITAFGETVSMRTAPKSGKFCIFGGYGSELAQRGERWVCPSPEAKHECAESETPTYACNVFGIQEKAVQQTACVPLEPLADLTFRCTGEIIKALDQPASISLQGLAQLFSDLENAVKTYEAKTGDFEKYDAYCAKNNEANAGKQKIECESITNLFAQFKTYLGTKDTILAAAAKRETTAQTAPAQPAKGTP